jgi:hypothetical protein
MTRGLQTVTNVCNKYSRLVMTYPCPAVVFCQISPSILHTVAGSRQRKCLPTTTMQFYTLLRGPGRGDFCPQQPCNFTHCCGVQAEEMSAHYNHAILHTVAVSSQRRCLPTTTMHFYTLLRVPGRGDVCPLQPCNFTHCCGV